MTIDGEYFEAGDIPCRIVDCWPAEVIGVSNGEYITLFWQGAEVARIWPRYKVGWTPEQGYVVMDVSMMTIETNLFPSEPPEAQ